MPSKNSINKPKDKILKNRKAASVGKKRAARARAGAFAPSRSSKDSVSGQARSTALALYTGSAQPSGVLTRDTLSKKRSQKIERNKRYIAKRKDLETKLSIDIAANEEQMEVDQQIPEPKPVKKTNLELVREALWSVVEDAVASGLQVVAGGEGTTLGLPVF